MRVQADDDVLGAVVGQAGLEDGRKEGGGLPSTPVEKFVVGAPVLVLAPVKADGAREGATPQPAEQAHGQRNGPPARAPL